MKPHGRFCQMSPHIVGLECVSRHHFMQSFLSRSNDAKRDVLEKTATRRLSVRSRGQSKRKKDACRSLTSQIGLEAKQQKYTAKQNHSLRNRSTHVAYPPPFNNHHGLTRPQLTKHPNSKDCQLWLLAINQRPEERRQSANQRVKRPYAAVGLPLIDGRRGRAEWKQTWIGDGPIFGEAHEAIEKACDDDEVE